MASGRVNPRALLCYGLLGWALGSVAVPIYIQVPYLYSRVYEVPAAWLGLILLLSRLLDAVLDPIIGLWIDRRCGLKNRYALPIIMALPLLLLGMAGVFFPLGATPLGYACSLMASLVVVHLGYSFATIAYQAWGSELGQTDSERSTFVAMREGLGIIGVIFAVSLSLEHYAHWVFTLFASTLLLGGYLLLKHGPLPLFSKPCPAPSQIKQSLYQQLNHGVRDAFGPLTHSNFRKLMLVFLCNGFAAALPATLVPFYMRDRLGFGDSEQWILGMYFLVGAASTIFWVHLAGRIGLARAWLLSMAFCVPAFVLVVNLHQGDLLGYVIVCCLTGIALGADLSLPAALVAKMIAQNKEQGQAEGTYFGLWNWVNKLNLALAPSFALGALQWFAYNPDLIKTPSFENLPLSQQLAQDPLIWMYALVPCVFKVVAMLLLVMGGFTQRQHQP